MFRGSGRGSGPEPACLIPDPKLRPHVPPAPQASGRQVFLEGSRMSVEPVRNR